MFPLSPLYYHLHITISQSQGLMHHTGRIFSWSLVLILKNHVNFKYSAIMCTYLFCYKRFSPSPNLPGSCRLLLLWLSGHQHTVSSCQLNWQCSIIRPQWNKVDIKRVFSPKSPSLCLLFWYPVILLIKNEKNIRCHFQEKRTSSFYFTRHMDFLVEKSRTNQSKKEETRG